MINAILKTVDSLQSGRAGNGKRPLRGLGLLSCTNAVDIRHVPFFEPSVIVVLAGRKVLRDGRATLNCASGEVATVPAPISLDIRNIPEGRAHPYRALIVPFQPALLERVAKAHDLPRPRNGGGARALQFARDDTLLAAMHHYLGSSNATRVREHRLMEVLLLLAEANPDLLGYAYAQASWSQRVRAVLGTDVARAWSLDEVCVRLASSESTLRRHLKYECTGFRELLAELRLSTALTQLLSTTRPIYRIAYDCGYQSVSRFSSNFHRRFGLPPRAFRASANESEQKLAVSGQRASV
jgi:AraC-like DNA-binding protein